MKNIIRVLVFIVMLFTIFPLFIFAICGENISESVRKLFTAIRINILQIRNYIAIKIGSKL